MARTVVRIVYIVIYIVIPVHPIILDFHDFAIVTLLSPSSIIIRCEGADAGNGGNEDKRE